MDLFHFGGGKVTTDRWRNFKALAPSYAKLLWRADIHTTRPTLLTREDAGNLLEPWGFEWKMTASHCRAPITDRAVIWSEIDTILNSKYNGINFDTILERVEAPYGYSKRVGGLRFAWITLKSTGNEPLGPREDSLKFLRASNKYSWRYPRQHEPGGPGIPSPPGFA